jgi:hypothetical protein
MRSRSGNEQMELSVAEEVERVTVRREAGSPDRSGPYTVVGLILGILIVAGVALAVIGVPEIQAWWGDGPQEPGTTRTTTTTVGP